MTTHTCGIRTAWYVCADFRAQLISPGILITAKTHRTGGAIQLRALTLTLPDVKAGVEWPRCGAFWLVMRMQAR